MTPVLIFGSGGTAKEVIGYIESHHSYEVIGVVSSEPFNNLDYANKYPVFSRAPHGFKAGFIMAVADPVVKRKLVAENEDRWTTYRHPSVHVSNYARVGKGCLFLANSCISGDAVIGDFATYNVYAQSGHDCVIGKYSTFSPYAETCGGCLVGDDVFFGARAIAIPKVRIVSGTKISAGAVVRHDITEPCTVYGDPAQPRRKT